LVRGAAIEGPVTDFGAADNFSAREM
jgi:hypothetical protein